MVHAISAARFAILTVLFALLGCATLTPPADPAVQVPAEYRRAMSATIILMTPSGDQPVCAGEFVSPVLIMTAHHCLESATGLIGDGPIFEGARIKYIAHDDWYSGVRLVRRLGGKVVRYDEPHDLALLKADGASDSWVDVGDEGLLGEAVQSIGHPYSEFYLVASGTVTGRRLVQGVSYTLALIAIGPGSSGGGLYNSQWRLVGVASRMNYGGSIGYFAPAHYVKQLIKG